MSLGQLCFYRFTEHHKDELEVVLKFGNDAGWKGLTSSTGLGNQGSSLAQLLQELCQEPVAESLTKNNRTTLLNAWSLKWRVVCQGDAFVVFTEVQAKKTSLLFPEMCNQCSLWVFMLSLQEQHFCIITKLYSDRDCYLSLLHAPAKQKIPYWAPLIMEN